MKLFVLIGTFLVIGAVVVLAYEGMSYTTRDKALDIGPLQVITEQTHTIPFIPTVGVTMLICGGGLVVVGLRRNC